MSKAYKSLQDFDEKTTAQSTDSVVLSSGNKRLTLAKIKTFVLKNFNPFSGYTAATAVTDANTLALLDASKTTTALLLKSYVNAEQGSAAASNLTVASTDPSGGEANDIWFKTDATKILSISVNDGGTWKSVDLSTL